MVMTVADYIVLKADSATATPSYQEVRTDGTGGENASGAAAGEDTPG